MNTKLLLHFVSIVDAGSVSAAALRLNLTQPALSRSLRELERAVGGPLLTRGPTGTELTALGQSVLIDARGVIAAEESFWQKAGQTSVGTGGTVRLGVGVNVAHFLLPPVLEHVHRMRPALKIDTHVTSDAPMLEEWLMSRRIEIVVAGIRNSLSSALIQRTRLGQYRLRAFVRPGHPLAGKKRVEPKALLAYGMANTRLSPGNEAAIAQACGLTRTTDLPCVLVGDSYGMVSRVVRNTDLVFITLNYAGLEDEAAGLLVPLELESPLATQSDLVLATLRNVPLSAAASFVREVVLENSRVPDLAAVPA